MPQPPMPDETTPAPAPAPPATARPSRRARWIGSVVAVLAMLGIGALAWHLTHRAPATAGASAAGGPGGPGGAGGAGGPGGGGGAGPGGRRGAPATTVGVAVAAKADIPIVIEALGTVTPAATVTVRPQVSGVLRSLAFREGQMVRAGQLLAEIDPRPFELALQQAVGQRQRDDAQLDNARLTLQRYSTLLGQDSIARQDVDTQAALVKQLEATVAIDRANEGTARLNLSYCRVVAPISGRLGLRVVDIGNVVSSGDAGGLAVITQLSPIDVEFSLPQDRVPELQAQLPAQNRSNVADAAMMAVALDRTRATALGQGRFLALDNVVDVQTGTVRAKARFANDKNTLFPSQFVNLQLRLRTIQGAVVVPVAALRHGSDGDFVYLLNPADRTVATRKVTRGQATADRVQITSGLQADDQVITEGGDRLKDGARVTLPGDRPASGAGTGQRRGERGGRGASGAGGAGGADDAGGASGGNRPSGASGESPARGTGGTGGTGGASGASGRRPADGASAPPGASDDAGRGERRRRAASGAGA